MMSKTEYENMIGIKEAANYLGIKTNIIKRHIEEGNLKSCDGKIEKSVVELIKNQMDTYIGIRSFMHRFDNDRFNAGHSRDRNKYIDFLEINDYFGINVISEGTTILYDSPGAEEFYISKDDAQLLEFRSEQFFRDFGLSEEEKVNRIINSETIHKLTKRYIREYIEFIGAEKMTYTPSFTEFVNLIFELPDICSITDEDIISAAETIEKVTTKKYFVDFLRYMEGNEPIKYGEVSLEKSEKEGMDSLPAYSYEKFVSLAYILFNTDYDDEHGLTINALENSVYIERWMFLACHYVCGWRAGDICNRWVYLNLKGNNNPFGINVETLKEDILNDNIPEKTYQQVALYVIRKIEMANIMPHKTQFGKLLAEITPELRAFFGKLVLIAEYHHLQTGKGYMNANRVWRYENWVECETQFGNDFLFITGRHNLSSRRLNKSYLQGLDEVARKKSEKTVMANMVASISRSHKDPKSIIFYLKDHGLTGETAGVVLYEMFQRSVCGNALYTLLISMYPDAFKTLPLKVQTQLMKKINISAYEIEALGNPVMAAESIRTLFAGGKITEPLQILKAMFAIGQGEGKAKDKGVHCILIALGMECEHYEYKSCIANLCPYHIFTVYAIPALIEVLKYYHNKAIMTGNRKYEVVLKKMIIPAFHEIINELYEYMTKEEAASITKLIEGSLSDETSKKE